VDLYDIRVTGLPSPLNRREISQLFRFGEIGQRTRCKPVGEAKWQTIDELFPLLKYEAGIRYQTREELNRGSSSGRIIAVSAVLLIATAILLSSLSQRLRPIQASRQVVTSTPSESLPENRPQTSSNSEAAAEAPHESALIPGAALETRAVAIRR
jgi:hypothetical protein